MALHAITPNQLDAVEITTEIVTVTPEMAAEMLSRNTHNRNLVKGALDVLVRALERDEWVLNGEAIKIADDGTILDGQHRLTACEMSGIPFQTLIIRGLPVETQESLDGGAKRTAAQMLKLRGVPNPNNAAAIARSLITRELMGVKTGIRPALSFFSPTRTEIVRYVVEHSERVQRLVSLTNRLRKEMGLSSGAMAVLIEEFEGQDYDDAAFFLERLLDRQALVKGDPIYELLRYYAAVRDKTARHRDAVTVAAVTIKAWNAFREGRKVAALRFRAGGAAPESFPEVI